MILSGKLPVSQVVSKALSAYGSGCTTHWSTFSPRPLQPGRLEKPSPPYIQRSYPASGLRSRPNYLRRSRSLPPQGFHVSRLDSDRWAAVPRWGWIESLRLPPASSASKAVRITTPIVIGDRDLGSSHYRIDHDGFSTDISCQTHRQLGHGPHRARLCRRTPSRPDRRSSP